MKAKNKSLLINKYKVVSSAAERFAIETEEVSYNHHMRFFRLKQYQHLKNIITKCCSGFSYKFVFEPLLSSISYWEFEFIYNLCTTPTLRKDYFVICNGAREYYEQKEAKINTLWDLPQTNSKFRAAVEIFLDEEICRLTASLEKNTDPSIERFKKLGNFFKLEPVELELLILCRVSFKDINTHYRREHDQSFTPEKINRYACALGISVEEMQRISKANARLRRLNCVDEYLEFNADLLPFLMGLEDEPLANRYYLKHDQPALPWTFYGELAKKHGDFLKMLISSNEKDKGMNILLYGEPGTGKTSFACSLAAELGLNAYFIAQSGSTADGAPRNYSNNYRFAALQVCEEQVQLHKSLIIIDEADNMLGSSKSFFMMLSESSSNDKGMLNSVMDAVKHPCIWITNTAAEALDPSSRRRFDYSIKFEKLATAQRALIWKNAAEKHGVSEQISEDILSKFAAKYEVSAGGIDLTLCNYSKLKNSGEVEKVVAKLLEPHCELMGLPEENHRFITAGDYCLEGLNIKGNLPLANIAPAIRRFNANADDGIDRPRMSLLFSGPPGTGKTEFVKYLGKTLNCKVLVKMGSDLLDKYVGGTEQNLKRAFAEAEAEKAILFLDEIDGMLQTREKALRSWEVTQVNELLYRMENFNCVMIGATNFIKNLDQATLRRFTFKLEFDYLNDDGKKIFFERMFKQSLPPEEELRLRAIHNLAPGDFRTVRQGLYYLNPQEITIADLLDGLERESAMKNGGEKTKTIGF